MKFAIALAVFALSLGATEIPKGAHVLLKMVNSINTKTATEGTQVYLQTASPISDGSQMIVPVGSYVQGIVTFSKRPGRVKGRAQLAIRIETLTLPGGKMMKFTPHLESVESGETGQKVSGNEGTVKQGSDVGHDAESIAILAGSGAAIGGLADRSFKGAGIGAGAGTAVGIAKTLLTRGKDVELRQGSTLDVIFDRALPVE